MKTYTVTEDFKRALQGKSLGGWYEDEMFLLDSAYRVIIQIDESLENQLTKSEASKLTVVGVDAQKLLGSHFEASGLPTKFDGFSVKKSYLLIMIKAYATVQAPLELPLINELIRTATRDREHRGYSNVGRKRVGEKRLTITMSADNYNTLKRKAKGGNISAYVRGMISKLA